MVMTTEPTRNAQTPVSKQYVELFHPAGLSGPAYLMAGHNHHTVSPERSAAAYLDPDAEPAGTSGQRLAVPLDTRIARILSVLNDAREQDSSLCVDDLAKGWRTREQVAQEVAHKSGYLIEHATVTAYVSRLLRTIKRERAALPSALHFDLVERKRGLGYRLGEDVELVVVDGSRRG